MQNLEKEPLLEGGSEPEIKGWDVFVDNPAPDEDDTLDSKWYQWSIKFLKVAAYFFTFVVVLGCSLVSKSLVLFMSSLIKPNRTGIPVCNHGIAGLDRDKRYETIFQLHDPERVAWIWSLLFILVVPEVMTLFRSVRICTFKSYRRPKLKEFFLVTLMETLHTIGLIMFVFAVLPAMNVVRGAMLSNCLCVLPGILSMLSRKSDEKWIPGKLLLDLLAILAQISAYVHWTLIEPLANTQDSPLKWMLPLSCIFISCGWWENFAGDYSQLDFIRSLAQMKESLHRSRYFIHILIAPFKIFIMVAGMFAVRFYLDGSCWYLLSQFRNAFSTHKVLVVRERAEVLGDGIDAEWLELDSFGSTALWFVFVQLAATWLCYVFGKFACKICIQGFSFTLPLLLTVPTCIIVFSVTCDMHLGDTCALANVLPRHLFWTCPSEPGNGSFVSIENVLWIVWIMSQIWICIHICRPRCERLATTEKLFVNPMYCSAFIDQSMMMNRRRDDLIVFKFKLDDDDPESVGVYAGTDRGVDSSATSTHYESIQDGNDDQRGYAGYRKKGKEKSVVQEDDYTTRLLICATMWHETKEEMLQMLKSLIRLDEDQCAKKNAKQFFNAKIQDYYEFDVHIFFDDAFELDYKSNEMIVNTYVKDFFGVLQKAACYVHQTEIIIKPPKKYPTPYGGRLEWTLPGSNKLIIHLKDKLKIRHRKRWSQVMYMYYLLGHCLMDQPIDVQRKAVRAENSYILALDGDIDFRPAAVQLLVDLMKKNRKLGAACGRIHPVGSGPMVWYQKFEYAIGHWLQKATEHMIGCVLCSPGCFSLFRAKALMDDNVMRKYTTKSEEALHYVQYDQGEDRWLCTLLLQRGYRVEYSAASDAYTHCPEGFGEFYTQRRRWAPSTMANIMDLLGDYKRTVAINDNISLPYIIYQGMLMVGTILGPGTIFLMLVGALVAVFRISNWYSFQLNLIPILLFMLICFTMKNEYQILAAQFLSACYALLMMAVFVGTSIQMTEDGISSPSAIFFLALTGTFFVAAILHPLEFGCVVPILLYFLTIPCMYMLLIVYSLINLNVVTWGTREKPAAVAPKTKKQLEEEKRLQEELKKKSLLSYFNKGDDNVDDGGIVISLANLFKCMFFTHQKPNEEKIHLIQIEESLKDIQKQVSKLDKAMNPSHSHSRRKGSSLSCRNNLETLNEQAEHDELMSHDSMSIREDDYDDDDDDDDDDMSLKNDQIERDDMVNPFWIEDKDLLNGAKCQLPEKEINFFNDLIKKYLYPLDENKEEQAKIASDLKDLRNRVVFGFVMVNALFILIVFLLQLNKDILHVEWPFGVRENITFIPETNEIRVEKHYLQMEPIGLVFVLFFGSILVIQFVGMMFHRFATLSHILASVELFESKKKLSTEDELNGNATQVAKQIQRLKGINDYQPPGPRDLAGRNIVERCEERKHMRRAVTGTLDFAFKKRIAQISNNELSTPILGFRNQEVLRQRGLNGLTLGQAATNQMQMNNLKPLDIFGNGTDENQTPFVRQSNSRATLDNKKCFFEMKS